MMEGMRKDMEAADQNVKPWQAAIKPGEYFQRYNQLGFTIYGEILQEEEKRPNHLKHYRLCRAYSVACPQGEMGDIHVSTIDALLSRELFDTARQRGWR